MLSKLKKSIIQGQSVVQHQSHTISTLFGIFVLVALLIACQPVFASDDIRFPPKPESSNWFSDNAGLIDSAEAEQINRVAKKLLREEKVALYVVTISSLAKYGAANYSIENYARRLFDEWGIGFTDRNYGVLLLISKQDRKARIELGKDWGREYDRDAQQVMDAMIIPEFKDGEFSNGIAQGVIGLDRMARDLELPSVPERPWWHYLFGLAACLFGRCGSGGGFGGGSSGGGGASGSW